MIDHFRNLEERLLRPAVRRSPDEADKLLAMDFIEFGSSGAVSNRQQIVDRLATEKSDGIVGHGLLGSGAV
jgi:hypothetical protein